MHLEADAQFWNVRFKLVMGEALGVNDLTIRHTCK